MKAYELLFFVDPAITEEQRAGVLKRIDATISDNGGKVDHDDNWGKRKLAYARSRSPHQRCREAPHDRAPSRSRVGRNGSGPRARGRIDRPARERQ